MLNKNVKLFCSVKYTGRYEAQKFKFSNLHKYLPIKILQYKSKYFY